MKNTPQTNQKQQAQTMQTSAKTSNKAKAASQPSNIIVQENQKKRDIKGDGKMNERYHRNDEQTTVAQSIMMAAQPIIMMMAPPRNMMMTQSKKMTHPTEQRHEDILSPQTPQGSINPTQIQAHYDNIFDRFSNNPDLIFSHQNSIFNNKPFTRVPSLEGESFNSTFQAPTSIQNPALIDIEENQMLQTTIEKLKAEKQMLQTQNQMFNAANQILEDKNQKLEAENQILKTQIKDLTKAITEVSKENSLLSNNCDTLGKTLELLSYSVKTTLPKKDNDTTEYLDFTLILMEKIKEEKIKEQKQGQSRK
jgi:hypothetical protein